MPFLLLLAQVQFWSPSVVPCSSEREEVSRTLPVFVGVGCRLPDCPRLGWLVGQMLASSRAVVELRARKRDKLQGGPLPRRHTEHSRVCPLRTAPQRFCCSFVLLPRPSAQSLTWALAPSVSSLGQTVGGFCCIQKTKLLVGVCPLSNFTLLVFFFPP